MTKTALRPNFVKDLPVFQQDEIKVNTEPTESELALFRLSQSDGWKILVGFIDQVTQDMDRVNSQAIAGGASFEEIGRNTIVINMAKDVINHIKNKVLDAADACQKANVQ